MTASHSDPAALLHEVSAAVGAITRHLSVHQVLEVIVSSARRLVGADYAAIGIPDDDGGFAEFITDGIGEEQRLEIGPLPRQHGMLAAILAETEPIRLDDLRRDPRFRWWPKAHPAMAALLGVPIRDGDRILGIVVLTNDLGKPGFTAADTDLIELLASHAAIAITNARLYERSRELTVVEERNRLARELHDAVMQRLFSLRLSARAAGKLLPEDPAAARERLDEVEQLAAEAVAELRGVIVELRPADLDVHGLVETLRRHTALLDRLHDTSVHFAVRSPVDLSRDGEVEVLRLVQEALGNAFRHAKARNVTLTIESERITIADDGLGFDADEAATRGLGLLSMRERAKALGGDLHLATAPGEGTVVTLILDNASDDTEREGSDV
ncbi:histidine kinase/DNA gyrase B/HSP90-like ATPase [Glycomyces artemisiae]|uniref:Histidine kinase/DNA gyrase B/HSP90-like ATPase n=1 Tax=Glycomyces artemisiae TaxID=1076443 RepID=A0A2T0UHT9_9ACTN|nr:GAF domain-containing sensor histidine kinase [Glycomyces artemisiae]PRY57472.1 histidine kinase/DNA gyrase B/HSP90-like ATPase [Glycomyces artemisiae]